MSSTSSVSKALLYSTHDSTSDLSPFLIQTRETQRIPPNNALLNRLTSFLPQMRLANEELNKTIKQEGQHTVDIETLSNNEQQQYIQMNLGLGVMEEKGRQVRRKKRPNIVDLTPDDQSSDIMQDNAHEDNNSDSDAESDGDSNPPDLATLVQQFIEESAENSEEASDSEHTNINDDNSETEIVSAVET